VKFFDRLFGKSLPLVEEPPHDDEPIVIVPIPPLIVLFHQLEKVKGSPLTEDEVFAALDNAACITMTASHRDQLAEKRGYHDINPDRVWEEWLMVREELNRDDSE
jgi:hypothetical protein